jgi:hypothetical protein
MDRRILSSSVDHQISSPPSPHTSPLNSRSDLLHVTIPDHDHDLRIRRHHRPQQRVNSPENQRIMIEKKTTSGRIAKIYIQEHHHSNERRSISPSRHDTARTCTGLKTYPKPRSPKKKFKLGTTSPVQRRCDSPIKSRILEIYKNFTPKMKNYKSINPRWKCG